MYIENKELKVTSEKVQKVLYQYYPQISHKTAEKIIKDLIIISDEKEGK